MLAHKATHEARVAVEAIAGEPSAFEPAAIPAVVFTDPEIAWCGLSEAGARARGLEVEIAKFPWGASARAATMGRSDGLTKLVLERGTERVLGVGIVGMGAGELIGEATLAVEMGARATDLSPHHPCAPRPLRDADGGGSGAVRREPAFSRPRAPLTRGCALRTARPKTETRRAR